MSLHLVPHLPNSVGRGRRTTASHTDTASIYIEIMLSLRKFETYVGNVLSFIIFHRMKLVFLNNVTFCLMYFV